MNTKTGWREVEIGRGSSDQICPDRALQQWLHFAKIDFDPIFVNTLRDVTRASETQLSDEHVACLIKQTVLDAGIGLDLRCDERLALFSSQSLRAGPANSVEVDERCVQKHFGHPSAKMTRRHQRHRDRVHANLTKAVGLQLSFKAFGASALCRGQGSWLRLKLLDRRLYPNGAQLVVGFTSSVRPVLLSCLVAFEEAKLPHRL